MKFMKQAALLVAILSCGALATAMGGTDVDADVLIGVLTCTGGNANCPLTQTMGVNAIGDPFNMTPAETEPTDLGTIPTETMKQLALPRQVDGFTAFKFTPSEGELAGTPIYLVLRMGPKGRRGTAMEGQYAVELLRFVPDSKNDWQRAGRFMVKAKEGTEGTSDITMFDLMIDEAGNASTKGPEGQVVTFDLGMKNLG